MNRISTYQIPLRVEDLRVPADTVFPLALAEPLQALVTALSRRTADAPVTIYLCADDESAAARDDFAFALAVTLTAHVPSTLLVDSDYLHPGLNGLVPQKDALGFLDYLLYGSSIGVITQDARGVHVVGAGSFPVTKRMPFIESAFADAAERLVAHARCVLFVGPAFDVDGGRHPLTGAVDIVATLRTRARDARLDSNEEQIAGTGVEVWSLRLGEAAAAPAPKPEPAPTPAPSVRPAAVSAPFEEAIAGSSGFSSRAPRIVVLVFGVLVIAFVVWWFMQNRSPTTVEETAVTPEVPVDSVSSAVDTVATAPPETTATAAPRPGPASTGTGTPAGAPRRDPADTAGRSGGTVLVNPDDIQVMQDLESKYRGWFVIHISSFQTSIRAREEVAFLESREFPAFIVFLDLGPKGKWYRIYAGPFATREEARDVKKNLDAIPQVRFTRIATIPD